MPMQKWQKKLYNFIMIKVIYAADTKQQFNLLVRSLETMTFCNGANKVSLIFLFHSRIKEHVSELAASYEKRGYQVEMNEFSERESHYLSQSKPGMLYWAFAPILFEGDKFIQIDNDTIINTSIDAILSEVKNKWADNAIFGARTNILFNSKIKRSLKQIHGKKNVNNLSRYINYGVVLINAENFRKIFKNESELIGYVRDKGEIARDFLLAETDQEIFFDKFKDKTGIISNKYNARIHRKKDFNWKEWNSEDSSYILHYNLYIEGKRKFNFNSFLTSDKDFNEKVKDLSSFYFMNNKKTKEAEEYIKVLSKIILNKNKHEKEINIGHNNA